MNHASHRLVVLPSMAILLAIVAGCASPPAPTADADESARLRRHTESVVAEHGSDLVASVYLAGPDAPFFALDADHWRPAASAIKTAYLIELFDRYAADLDAPIDAIADVLADDDHPGIVHFAAADRAEIRRTLTGVGARRLGAIMIHGDGVPNVVYNAAANVVTALCGGPEALTASIRARHRDAQGFAVRRYMLARRDVTGDNELTAGSLGRVWQGLARRDTPGLDAATIDAVLGVLHLTRDPGHYYKGGALNSTPPCRLRTGMVVRDETTLVYVVAVTTRDGGAGAADAGTRLEACARELARVLPEIAQKSPNLD